ncbi:DUF11 domain-containing protein [Rugosimonospora africana]|uniref:DUF11 domain-containing protein n=1 Tax=Rugosimonospora africana TaxID=556532 RepID=UPI0019413B39|nr:DUF11 domain-containing protein [Rugosimonospora africana]
MTVILLVGALMVSPAAARADDGGTAAPAYVEDSAAPGESPTPDGSPTPGPTDAQPDSPTPPPPGSPTPDQPQPSATTADPEQGGTGSPGLRVRVYASNAVLDDRYWSGANSTSFTITVRNTGTATATVAVDYTVPAGVTDVATGACQHGHCSVSSVSPGASVPLPVAITVSADAWRSAPLTGRLTFTVSATGASDVSGQRTWGLIFPPGPPAPGIDLRVDDVTMDAQPDVPAQLKIRLTDSGSQPAAATVDVVVPDGVTTGTMSGCESQGRPSGSTARCVLGALPAGGQKTILVPLTANAEARANAPLAGLVRATLSPPGQAGRTTQASYEIDVPADQTGVSVAAAASVVPAPTMGNHGGSYVLSSRSAVAWPMITVSSAVLITVIVVLVMVLRGRPVAAGPRLAGPAGGTFMSGAASVEPADRTAGAEPAGLKLAESVPVDSVPVDSVPVESVPAEEEPAGSEPVGKEPAEAGQGPADDSGEDPEDAAGRS